VHGKQEGSAYNGHFKSTCYHPLFVFNQHGALRSIQLKLVKIGARIISHSRRTVLQLAEVAVSEALFVKILARIHRLRYVPT
jgi:hypothetical protein